jgi:hypothetical protein
LYLARPVAIVQDTFAEEGEKQSQRPENCNRDNGCQLKNEMQLVGGHAREGRKKSLPVRLL